MILHTALLWLGQNINQTLNSHRTPPYLDLTGELRGVSCDRFEDNFILLYLWKDQRGRCRLPSSYRCWIERWHMTQRHLVSTWYRRVWSGRPRWCHLKHRRTFGINTLRPRQNDRHQIIYSYSVYNWGFWHQKQVSHAGITNCIPQYSVRCNYLSLPEIPASATKVLLFLFLGLVKCRLAWQCFGPACHSDWRYLKRFRHGWNIIVVADGLAPIWFCNAPFINIAYLRLGHG